MILFSVFTESLEVKRGSFSVLDFLPTRIRNAVMISYGPCNSKQNALNLHLRMTPFNAPLRLRRSNLVGHAGAKRLPCGGLVSADDRGEIFPQDVERQGELGFAHVPRFV